MLRHLPLHQEVYSCKQGVKYRGSAADFLIDTVKGQPGEVTVLALGPLTNVALAMQKDPSFSQHVVSESPSSLCLFTTKIGRLVSPHDTKYKYIYSVAYQ